MGTALCPDCGVQVDVDANFCTDCGTDLREYDLGDDDQPAPVSDICPNCGVRVDDGNFCTACGTDLRNR